MNERQVPSSRALRQHKSHGFPISKNILISLFSYFSIIMHFAFAIQIVNELLEVKHSCRIATLGHIPPSSSLSRYWEIKILDLLIDFTVINSSQPEVNREVKSNTM